MKKVLRENILFITGALILMVALLLATRLPQAEGAVEWFKMVIYWPIILKIAREVFLNPVFYALVAGILVIEKLLPAKPNQKVVSVGIFQDVGWLVFALFFEAFVVVAYIRLLQNFYTSHLSFLKLEVIAAQPEIIRFIIAALFGDFLSWFQHWLKHKIGLFWEFHALHHSQRQMNLFTDFRFHFMEYLISRTIYIIPMMIFTVDTVHIVAYAVFTMWLTRFYHANIKMNFGPLRYIFVTPQSHRIHHSIEERHWDKNFGVVFSIWDRLFGTQYKNADEYPDTGIADEEFPLEMEFSLLSVLIMGYRQTIYPFLRIVGKTKH